MIELESANTKIVAISYDSVDDLKKFADTKGVSFPLLSDPDSEVIRAYGVHNDGYAHPGTYLIDKTGVVRWARFLDSYKKRHTVPELLEAARRLIMQ